MRGSEKSGFLWPFVGGFLLGAVGLVVLQPAAATRTLEHTLVTAAHLKG